MQGMGWGGAMRRPRDSGGGGHRRGPRQGVRRWHGPRQAVRTAVARTRIGAAALDTDGAQGERVRDRVCVC